MFSGVEGACVGAVEVVEVDGDAFAEQEVDDFGIQCGFAKQVDFLDGFYGEGASAFAGFVEECVLFAFQGTCLEDVEGLFHIQQNSK